MEVILKKLVNNPLYMAIWCLVGGVAVLAISAWRHRLLETMLGLALVALGPLFALIWHRQQIAMTRRSANELKNQQLQLLAEQSALMIAKLIELHDLSLNVKVSAWGRDENGAYSGWAVDVVDEFSRKMLWSVNLDALGASPTKVWIAEGEDGLCTSMDSRWKARLEHLMSRPSI